MKISLYSLLGDPDLAKKEFREKLKLNNPDERSVKNSKFPHSEEFCKQFPFFFPPSHDSSLSKQSITPPVMQEISLLYEKSFYEPCNFHNHTDDPVIKEYLETVKYLYLCIESQLREFAIVILKCLLSCHPQATSNHASPIKISLEKPNMLENSAIQLREQEILSKNILSFLLLLLKHFKNYGT